MQLGDATVCGEEKSKGGHRNDIHWIAGAAVDFAKRRNGASRGKFPLLLPVPFDANPIEVCWPRVRTGPCERAGNEAVIVEKAANCFKFPTGLIRRSLTVGGPARCGGDVEVVAPHVSNRLAGPTECLVEEPDRRKRLPSDDVGGKPVLVAYVCFEEVDVPGIQRRVVLNFIWGLLQRMPPRYARCVQAPRYFGDAAKFPCRRIPVEVGAKGDEVMARIADELCKPAIRAQRRRSLEQRKFSHSMPPPASGGTDWRLPRWPSSSRRSHWPLAGNNHPRVAPRARPQVSEAGLRVVHPAKDGMSRRCNTRAAPDACSSSDHRTSLRLLLPLLQCDGCLAHRRRMTPRSQQPRP